MRTDITSSDLSPESASVLLQAKAALERGAVIGYPSETVWGLAALPRYLPALQRRKAREQAKPVQASCADAEAALALAQPNPALPLLRSFWPGPLTVVTRAAPACPPELAPGGWVGLRVPAHGLIQALLRETGPLATTSLNPAGQPPALTFAQAHAYNAQYALADLLLGSDTDTADGLASTVLHLPVASEGSVARVVREGAISVEALQVALVPLGLRVEGESR